MMPPRTPFVNAPYLPRGLRFAPLFHSLLGGSVFFFCCLTLHAQSAGDLVSRGDSLDRLHRHREALEMYQQAARTGPENAGILRRMAGQYSLLMEETPDFAQKRDLGRKALVCAEKAKALAPKDAKVRLSLAIVYGKTALLESPGKQMEMSRLIKEEIDASIALNPQDSLAWYVLGRWNYEIANLNPILKGLARTIFGKFPEAGNAEAAACFEKAISLGPQRPANYIELGRTYAAMGNPSGAREQINKGLAMTASEKDDAEAKERGRKTLQSL